jgi:hypothetical protein
MALSGFNPGFYESDGSASTITSPGNSALGNSLSPADSVGARLATAGLTSGANGLLTDIAGSVFNIDFQNTDGTQISPEDDWRVRISMGQTMAGMFYDNPANTLLRPLNSRIGTAGVVFPYTPTITLSHTARYGSQGLTHSNYNSYFYEGSEVGAVQINGEFTVQNIAEGQYLMAVIQFFRICTKMFFGADQYAGSPPPLVFLDGYGAAYLPHIPCVVTQFSHTMQGEVDYVSVPIGVDLGPGGNSVFPGNITGDSYGKSVRLPTDSTITVTLQPVYSRKNIADNFTLEKYARGLTIKDGNSNRGGFI